MPLALADICPWLDNAEQTCALRTRKSRPDEMFERSKKPTRQGQVAEQVLRLLGFACQRVVVIWGMWGHAEDKDGRQLGRYLHFARRQSTKSPIGHMTKAAAVGGGYHICRHLSSHPHPTHSQISWTYLSVSCCSVQIQDVSLLVRPFTAAIALTMSYVYVLILRIHPLHKSGHS